jgi:hypothetical protein
LKRERAEFLQGFPGLDSAIVEGLIE